MIRWPTLFTGLILLLNETPRCDASTDVAGPQDPAADYVVLIHGLGRTSISMKRLEWSLKREGYRVINSSYPSTLISIETAANVWLKNLLRDKISDPTARVHFVTHSLGGIILRQHLRDHPLENIGRVVMVAPPNQGSELAHKLGKNFLYRILTGPSGQQLGTDANHGPRSLGPARFELGVVAGNRSLNPLFSWLIPGADDGKVSVASTKLEGMKAFTVVRHSHTWMMWKQSVIAATIQFLETGCFDPEPPPADQWVEIGGSALF